MRASLLLFVVIGALPALAASPAPGLETTTVTYRTVPREYRFDGVVEAIRRTTVSAQTRGQVVELLYDVHDFVEKNAVVARLDDTEQRARVIEAAAGLKSAAAALLHAEEEYTRVQGLHAKGLASAADLDAATAKRESARAAREAATARLDQAKEELDYTEIRAPYAGIVTHRHIEVGETASEGQPVMTGISLEELRVLVDVPQGLIPEVRRGAVVHVHLPGGDRVAPAKVTVFPFAELISGTFKLRADLPPGTPDLFPGMFVETALVVGAQDELVVPKEAVVYRSEVTGVYVRGPDGRLSLRHIRLGRDLGDASAVLAGLSAGEEVVLDPIAAGAALKAAALEAAGLEVPAAPAEAKRHGH